MVVWKIGLDWEWKRRLRFWQDCTGLGCGIGFGAGKLIVSGAFFLLSG